MSKYGNFPSEVWDVDINNSFVRFCLHPASPGFSGVNKPALSNAYQPAWGEAASAERGAAGECFSPAPQQKLALPGQVSRGGAASEAAPNVS